MRWRILAGVTGAMLALAIPALGGKAVTSQAHLEDLRTAVDPTDGGWAVATGVRQPGSTLVVLNVKGMDPGATGRRLGAHVHVGPCVAGNGGAASGHYNHGGVVSAQTEVWLDFTVTGGGTGHATTRVPFEIPEGAAASIVIHEFPTDAISGLAGGRMACIGIEF
ncbi:MAG: hypothetical protein Q8Q52_07875 [Acidimicrobiia bacterium]|nr:hypothetical protein [Acidimicrobiia bacterium]